MSINKLDINNINIQPINYVTGGKEEEENLKTPDFTEDSTGVVVFQENENNVILPTFFNQGNTIQLPKGIKRQVDRLPKRILSRIDDNVDLAKEKCLILASTLTYTVFNEDQDYWKGLSSVVLNKQLRKGKDNTYIYKHVINALTYTTRITTPIFECQKNIYGRDTYLKDNYSKQYRYHITKKSKKLASYELKFNENIQNRRKHYLKELNKAYANPIGKNLINVYEQITIPEEEEIKIYGKYLEKQKHTNKKGKLLTSLKGKSKEYYSNAKQRTFVEDNLKQFNYLTKLGYIIPKIGDYKSGGRVVDSFNLMPSWIRSLVKIDNESLVELDFKALHPNIAKYIYGGSNTHISHNDIAHDLDIPKGKVKIEHLSFFNKEYYQMKQSPLYEYYKSREYNMLTKIINDKNANGYKKTSQNLFKKEVEIMSTIIKQLNSIGIYVLYVYDALYCKDSDKKIVTDIMNRTIKQQGVNSYVG